MSEDSNSISNNLCIAEDAFEQFQAVSMYQEKEIITLPIQASVQLKEPDPGEKLTRCATETVVSTEKEVNSTVNNTKKVESSRCQETLGVSSSENSENINDFDVSKNNLNSKLKPQSATKRGRKKKVNNINTGTSNVIILGTRESCDKQLKPEEETSVASSTPPPKRGRKSISNTPDGNKPSGMDQDSSVISSPPLSSDLDNSDLLSIVVRRKRGRPRKASITNETIPKPPPSDKISDTILPRRRGRPKKQKNDNSLSSPTNDKNNLLGDATNIDLNSSESTDGLKKGQEQTDIVIKTAECNINIESDSTNDDDICLSKLKTNKKPIPNDHLSENGEICKNENNSGNTDLSKLCGKTENGSSLTKIEPSKDIIIVKKSDSVKCDLPNTEINSTVRVSPTEDLTILDVESINDIDDTFTKQNNKMPIITDIDSIMDKEITAAEEHPENSALVVDTSKRPVRRKVPKLRYDEGSDEDPFANIELSDDDDEPRNRKGNRYYSDDEYVPGRRGNKDIDSTDSEAQALLNETVKKQKKKRLRKKSESRSPRKKGKQQSSSSKQINQDAESDIEICVPATTSQSSDVEICLPNAAGEINDEAQSQPTTNSKTWGCSNEFENFIAKKIQGTNLQIKKVSATDSGENKTLEIPVIDPDAKKSVDMWSQTNKIDTASTFVQTKSPFESKMKINVNLTSEQSQSACSFLNGIVKMTSELGTLMIEKSEDFMKKKINTTHVTDTMKMDYCVRKSFLLFKLAKHNLEKMEEDLESQYEQFLEAHNLTACREVEKEIAPSSKKDNSDSDCEIVDEPVVSTPVNKSKEKPKFNPKTVFLNKELSIKIAKKPTENKTLDIKGRHTVWINDTVMVKKVKPTQSFLAQDSRNKKPPDNKITTKMVSDFFTNYYRRQKAISICAPFLTTNWLNVTQECVCNYFVVKQDQFNNNDYTANVGINTENNASTSEIINDIKQIPNSAKVTCPETLLQLCIRIANNKINDKRAVIETSQHMQNEITDGKNQPETLFRLCLRVLTHRAVYIKERSATHSKIINPCTTSSVPCLKTLCYEKVVALLHYSARRKPEEHRKQEETRCSTEKTNKLIPTSLSENLLSSNNINMEMQSLISNCVEMHSPETLLQLCIQIVNNDKKPKCLPFKEISEHIQNTLTYVEHQPETLFRLCLDVLTTQLDIKENIDPESIFQESQNIISVYNPKSLKLYAYKYVKQLIFGDINDCSFETNHFNLNQPDNETMIEGLTINSVNTLSEEAFLSLEQAQADDIAQEYLEEFDENHYDDGDNYSEAMPEENESEPNWVSQVQMQELRSCTVNCDENQEEFSPLVAQIKIEPIDDDLPDNVHSLTQVKVEPIHAPDEMTMIPDVKIESLEDLCPDPIQKDSSKSYDVDTFETFVSSSKIIAGLRDDIFSQSALRVHRRHEPDYEEDDTSMSLLVPQTYEPLSIETAKGSLMQSSSDEDGTKNKKVAGKKKVDKKSKGKPKKPEAKANKEIPTVPTKDKPSSNEVANLTKRLRDKIRQEEKKDDSTDSEPENIPVRSRNKKEQEKTKQSQASKDDEIQCNNVDSTDQVDENASSFIGFSAIDQNEISTYHKYMKFVYDKILPEKESDKAKTNKVNENDEEPGTKNDTPLIANEPIELLECEPLMPVLDEPLSNRRHSRKNLKKDVLQKEQAKVEETSKEEIAKQEEMPKFIDRHGWHCYPVNGNDKKLYLSSSISLEKLPESFVQTYFEYQGITSKSTEDEEINRLTNLNSLNRSGQSQNLGKNKLKPKQKELKTEHASEAGSRSESPTYSDHHELEPSDDEGASIEDETAPPVATRNTENTLAKNLLMNDNESDSDDVTGKVKQEPVEEGYETRHRSKRKIESTVDKEDLMLTADKMMNKELTLLHAPVVVNDVHSTPIEGPVTRNKQKTAMKSQPGSSTKMKTEEDSSSEEEKQWVTTKEKLLKRMGKKDQASLDDAKRAKLVSEFIERRSDRANTRLRKSGRPRRSAKKFLEREKQLGILSRELFGESTDASMSKRSQASVFKGRRNIRKVIDKKSLARSTVVANMEEFERKRRLNAKQTKLRELLGCEEGVNVLVINDEVCLEYDFEENRPVVTVHPFFTKVMKAHQYEGVKFMWDACFESLSEIAAGRPGGGCILAHCMGLGKTLQVLALLHTVLTHPGVKMQRVLVCCPLSTVLNWVDEIHKWIGPVTNQIKVFELSKLKKTYERAYQLEDWYNGGGIFIIGYELFRSLTTLDPFLDDVRPTIINKIRTALLDPGPDIIVCDEGHLLKNDCSVLAVAMSRVVTKRRIILTGTPMQNNLREYYCMVNFVKPNLLGTYAEYSNRFENPIMNGQHRDSSDEDIKLMKARTHILHKVLEGCLQRQEASVLYPYLPKKHEYTVFITLTQCQWDLYKHYLQSYAKQSKQSILKDFHILQKIWSHPQVLHNFQTKARDRAEANKLLKAEKLEDDLATEDVEDIKPNVSEDLWWLDYLDGGSMLETLDSSNKFVVVFRLLDECIALGDKVLIFSTSLFCLDGLEYFLKKMKNWSLGNEYYRLDGSVPAEVRQKWCREFNADSNTKTKLFLVSTRAGCLGLNMTAANRVIIMDTSWNPAHDIQSIFRVYRFGQKKDCYIYRLVAMGTMEQKIYERSVTKQAVACRVVDEQQIDRHYNSAELTELYLYDEAGACVAGGVAAGVRDVALLRVARDAVCAARTLHAVHAVHEHDSLLRGEHEQALPEHERNAVWMQFQQEQHHKHLEGEVDSKPPKIALKRITNAESQKPTTEVKTEPKDEDFVPNEPKAKKGKKSSVAHIKSSSNNKKTPPKSGTSKQPEEPPPPSPPPPPSQPSTSSTTQPTQEDIAEEILVDQITDILLKYNFQNRKRKHVDIVHVVMKVRKIVQKGYLEEKDWEDDMTANIAQVLLRQDTTLPKVNDIVCESINNSAAPNAALEDNEETDTVSKTNTNERTKRRAAIAAEKSIDSLSEDVISLDDDEWTADTEFIPDSLDKSSSKSKKKLRHSPKVVSMDEDTLSADEQPGTLSDTMISSVQSFKTSDKPKPPEPEPKLVPKKPISVKKSKKVIKTYRPAETKPRSEETEPWSTETQPHLVEMRSRPVKIAPRPETKPRPVETKSQPPKMPENHVKVTEPMESSITLSDDDDIPVNTSAPSHNIKDRTHTPEKPDKDQSTVDLDDEIVPLPMALLKNQNFINIVAHTYLVGNPMLDEDAATLAAQYSTLKAFNEAEQTGNPVCSGPIYDIAVKVLGKDVMKKMNSGNPTAASASADDAATSLQMKDQMITTQKTFEETAKKSKAKSTTLREQMIKDKLNAHIHSAKQRVATPPPSVTPSSIVPVGLIRTTARESRVECILPDNDDIIISDVHSAAAPTPTVPEPNEITHKPILLNTLLCRQETPAAKVNLRTTPIQTGIPTNIILKPVRNYTHKVKPILTDSSSTPVKAPPPVSVPGAPAPAPGGTICLDSDDEDGPAPAAAPVPVSLTSALAPGLKLPLPNQLGVTNQVLQNCTAATTQKLVLRQFPAGDSTQAKYVLIPSDKLPLLKLPPKQQTVPIAPKPSPLHPKVKDDLFRKTITESIVQTNKTFKTGDVLRLTKDGKIELITNKKTADPPHSTKPQVAVSTNTNSGIVDLTELPTANGEVLKKKQSSKIEKNTGVSKVEARKARQISVASSSSSTSSAGRAASPDNPLSILKDVVHIKATDYQSSDAAARHTATRPDKSNQRVGEASATIAVSLQDAASNSKSILKLTKVPKDQVPKHIDQAVEKEIRKNVYVKKATTNPPKPKEQPKPSSSTTTTSSSKVTRGPASKKVTSKLQAQTVDLTNLPWVGTTVKSKNDGKRQPTTDTTPAKKKRPEPMTLKDFDLDDIDDIIELD
ncbi:uncharacterized protein LOC118265808 isoform X2 [Spodoptera frugiperda]|uniref:Uncharacterized protein LOC118265808 isoform X2 n=1 Tax=Spodoptera frugiperda TaxID=7108 RepID=A0A9R0EHG0_SPOFR|nr:uncharacterized protein LOC118265808 isoform X2 [Spodoptera frugiperda]